MNAEPLELPEVRRALAAIEKGHELEGQELSDEELDRARRILAGELTPEAARWEMNAALQAVVDAERA
ncbi:antitoxin VbhA family protein [Microbacterium sp. KSW4-4]|uniref:antitoxin VbhA family protein n=1 Tax=Microbacterium sp. KSW4-4 TaxID=2851651 RepID=UPI001FFDEB2F|nr:antitoxin VbhA family protein [Microbacterium sp. KSW4-4]MCK2032207.1 antitoxin VbhA family protein [Microbacterium sp. KSW4-4]